MGMADGLAFEYQEKRIQDGKDEAKRIKSRKVKLLRLIKEYRQVTLERTAHKVLMDIEKVLGTI